MTAESQQHDLTGERAPDFELESTAGGTVRLTETLADGPSVVVLFRGHWCSYCAEQLQSFSALGYDMWRHLDVDVLPVTGDPVPELVEMRDRFDLSVQLLSNPDLAVARDYTGIEDNDTYGAVPIPGTFVVDTDGVVRYAQVADRPDDRTFANYVRHFITEGFQDGYPGTYPDPYSE